MRRVAFGQLALDLVHAMRDGSRVDVVCSSRYRMPGTLIGRFTYADGTEGARVETDCGALVVVPLGEVMPAGVTV